MKMKKILIPVTTVATLASVVAPAMVLTSCGSSYNTIGFDFTRNNQGDRPVFKPTIEQQVGSEETQESEQDKYYEAITNNNRIILEDVLYSLNWLNFSGKANVGVNSINKQEHRLSFLLKLDGTLAISESEQYNFSNCSLEFKNVKFKAYFDTEDMAFIGAANYAETTFNALDGSIWDDEGWTIKTSGSVNGAPIPVSINSKTTQESLMAIAEIIFAYGSFFSYYMQNIICPDLVLGWDFSEVAPFNPELYADQHEEQNFANSAAASEEYFDPEGETPDNILPVDFLNKLQDHEGDFGIEDALVLVSLPEIEFDENFDSNNGAYRVSFSVAVSGTVKAGDTSIVLPWLVVNLNNLPLEIDKNDEGKLFIDSAFNRTTEPDMWSTNEEWSITASYFTDEGIDYSVFVTVDNTEDSVLIKPIAEWFIRDRLTFRSWYLGKCTIGA